MLIWISSNTNTCLIGSNERYSYIVIFIEVLLLKLQFLHPEAIIESIIFRDEESKSDMSGPGRWNSTFLVFVWTRSIYYFVGMRSQWIYSWKWKLNGLVQDSKYFDETLHVFLYAKSLLYRIDVCFPYGPKQTTVIYLLTLIACILILINTWNINDI